MKVDSARIRSEREQRAWSQEHLARLAGLGLRTIQRIEANGAASYESTSAIASVLEIPVAALRVEDAEAARRSVRFGLGRRAAAVTAVVAAAMAAILVTRTVVAEQVMVDVGISVNGEERGTGRMLAEEGKTAEMRIDDVLRFVIVPTIRDDGSIMLSTEVHLFDGSEYVLVSSPRVASTSDKLAEIRFGSESGDLYRFLLTPKLQ